MSRTRDMTTGSPCKLLLWFCVPILLSNVLQQLYNLVDSLVIGQVEGVAALAAVSSAGWLDWGVMGIAMGLADGFAIELSQRFGAHDYDGLKRCAGQSVILSIAVLAVLEGVAQSLLRPLLTLMKTPAETYELTCIYLRVIFGGMPFIIGFNLLSGFLRSVGDSRTPLLAMFAAGVSNVVLDITFVAVLRMGVAGAALATSLAQGFSCVVCLLAVRKLDVLHFSAKKDMKPDGGAIKRLLKLGLPMSFQNTVISVGGLVLQGVVNSFGFVFMAGFSAASRLQGVVEIGGTAIASSMCTYTGQNMGAGNIKRIKEGMKWCRIIAAGMAVIIAAIMLIFGKNILLLFINDTPELVSEVLAIAYKFLIFMSLGLIGLYMLFVHRSTLQGLGDTVIPFISGVVELVVRVGCAFILPRFVGQEGLFWTEILAWAVAGVYLIFGYYYRMHRVEKQLA